MEYGKTFGTEASYFTPKAQLTWSQVGAKDYTAHTPNDSMRIDQDAYSSLVARFGVEAGAKSEKGRVYVGLYLMATSQQATLLRTAAISTPASTARIPGWK